MPQFQARPTNYRGIQMRSRLEAGYAAWLDQWGFHWEYEPQAFASPSGQYLPDFLLKQVPAATGDGKVRTTDVYVEVKPSSRTGDLDALGKRMAIITESHRDATLLLETPGQAPRETFVLLYPEPRVCWQECAWTYNVAGQNDPHGRESGSEYLALAWTIERDHQPWPHGYWNGPA